MGTSEIYHQKHVVEEVGAVFRASKNAKSKHVIALICSCGWRRGELINPGPEDIDSKRLSIKKNY